MTTTAIFSATHWTANQSQPEVPVNEALNVFDAGIAGTITVNASADSDQTLVVTGAKPQAWQYSRIILTDTSAVWSGAHNVIVPDNAKNYIFTNNASTGFDATIKTATGSGVAVPYGVTIYCRCDGSSIINDVAQSYSSSIFTASQFEDTLFKSYRETRVVNVSASSAVSLSCASANVFDLTLIGNVSVVFTDVPSVGNTLFTSTVFITQDGTGARSLNVQGAIYASGAASTVSQVGSSKDIWIFTTNDAGTTWYGMAAGLDFK